MDASIARWRLNTASAWSSRIDRPDAFSIALAFPWPSAPDDDGPSYLLQQIVYGILHSTASWRATLPGGPGGCASAVVPCCPQGFLAPPLVRTMSGRSGHGSAVDC